MKELSEESGYRNRAFSPSKSGLTDTFLWPKCKLSDLSIFIFVTYKIFIFKNVNYFLQEKIEAPALPFYIKIPLIFLIET
jgi:hypothetical protein